MKDDDLETFGTVIILVLIGLIVTIIGLIVTHLLWSWPA